MMRFKIGRRIMARLVLSCATFDIFTFLTVSTVPCIHSVGGRLASRTTTSIPVCIIVCVDLDVEVVSFLESSFAFQRLEVGVFLHSWSSFRAIVVECDDTLNIGPKKTSQTPFSALRAYYKYCTVLFFPLSLESDHCL